MLDENITWEKHIRTIESKLAKNIGLLYLAKLLLQVKYLKSIYFAYIHSYLNYVNIAWGSTYKTKLKTIYFHQKHAVRIVFNEDKLTHSSTFASTTCIKCLPNKSLLAFKFHVQTQYKSSAFNF